MHSKRKQIIDSHAFKHAFIQKIINLKMVSWSSDTRSSKNYPLIQKFWYVDPLQKQRRICFWHLIPCRSKVFAIHYFLTPCRSKVITLFSRLPVSKVTIIWIRWYADPLQMQDHICFGTRSPCRSKVLAILYFSTPYRSKVTTIIYFFDSLQK